MKWVVNCTQLVDRYWISIDISSILGCSSRCQSFVLSCFYLSLVANPALSVLPLPGPGYVGDCGACVLRKMSHTTSLPIC